MKKLLAVIGLFVFAATLCTAAGLRENLQAQVAKEIQKAAQNQTSNTGAIHKNTTVAFEVQDFYGERVGEKMDTACKAYPIAKHWLLVAGTCARPVNFKSELFGTLFVTKHNLTPYSSNIRFVYNSRIMLIWSDYYNFTGPFVNVLATDSPEQLFTLSASHDIKINTARWGMDSVKTRSLKSGSIKEGAEDKVLFQLKESAADLSGTATDPLFLIEKEGLHNEFLAAYNDGIMDYTFGNWPYHHGRTSENWYSLHLGDLQFIKDTVLKNRPADWAQIKTRLFYNQTEKPVVHVN